MSTQAPIAYDLSEIEDDMLDPGKKVAEVVRQHPDTWKVFKEYGCPDMREGFFSLMARIMSIRNAARIHGIPLDELMVDLEAVIADTDPGTETT